MRRILPAAIGAAVAVLLAASAVAETAPAAPNSLERLLDQVQSAGQRQQAQLAAHRAAFAAASPEQQKTMMKDALAARDKAKAAASQASERFSANDVKITKLTQQLQGQVDAAGLAGVFSSAKQDADHVASTLHNALTNTQFSPPDGGPGRLAFLQALSNQSSTPTLGNLQRLWYEIQREMTAQGQVVRYQAAVVRSNNESVLSPVIRIGPFTATSEGRFLEYLPGLNALAVLPRELPGGFRATLAHFQNTTQGYVSAVVDPSSGTLLQMYIQSPTWGQRIFSKGPKIGYVILIVGVIGLILWIIQVIRLVVVRFLVSQQLKDMDHPRSNNPLGRVLLAFKGDPSRIEEDAEIAELRLTEAVLKEEPKLERFQSYLRLAVAAGPLLGLIGTVVGMIETFQTITETGSADPRLMATGIGHAMIATVLGLSIAIPLLFGNALLKSLSENLVQILDKQSTGMLAERTERQRDEEQKSGRRGGKTRSRRDEAEMADRQSGDLLAGK